MTPQIDFEPVGRRVQVEGHSTLLDAARRIVLADESGLNAVCGGQGWCGRCRVRVLDGPVSDPTPAELRRLTEAELAAGHRLACQARALGPMRVEIPPESLAGRQQLQVEGMPVSVEPEPAVTRHIVELVPSTLEQPLSVGQQVERFLRDEAGLAEPRFDVEALRRQPARSTGEPIVVSLYRGEVVNLRPLAPGCRPPRALGLAVDLGTTKMAGYLIDLETGETLATAGLMNPQISYGEDLMSRLSYASNSPDGLVELSRLAVAGIDALLETLLTESEEERGHVEEAVVVGNTAMHHLLVGLPVGDLASAPYLPSLSTPLEVKARELGLSLAPGAYLHLLAPVAGFVGGDHVAFVLATRVHESLGTVLGLDIGTNTEIVLAHRGRLISCSCPSGPTFEGAHISQGMRAVEGAISAVELTDDGRGVRYQTVGGRAPLGICGSGVVDAVAELVRHGIVNQFGILAADHPRVKAGEGGVDRSFLLVSADEAGVEADLVLTQQDVGQIQLAKGAIASGVELLLRAAGVDAEDVEAVLLAGAFGTHLRVESARTLGLLPDLPLARFQQVGNAAGTGARLALVSLTERRLAAELARRIEYVELTVQPDFGAVYARSLRFASHQALLPPESWPSTR